MIVMILAANVLMIEIIPVAFIAKIQPARSVFIYRFFLAGLLAYCAARLVQKKHYTLAVILIFSAAFPQITNRSYSGFFVGVEGFGALIFASGARKDSPLRKMLGMCIAALAFILLLWLPWYKLTATTVYKVLLAISYVMGLLMIIGLGGVFMALENNGRRRIYAGAVMVLLFAGMLGYQFVDVRGSFDAVTFKSVAGRIAPADATGDIESIALEFKQRTGEDALFLGDPYNINTSYFRLFSERSSVVTFKNMPFTDEGMLEWVSRLERMGAVSKGPDGRFISHERALPRMAPEDVLEYAGSYGAGYLLLTYDQEKIDRYVELGCSVFLTNDFWAVLKLS
jgi:hypothetical protein